MDCEAHGKTEGTGNWEAILAPIDCNYYAISDQDGPTWQKCSDPQNADTSRNFAAGESFVVSSPHCGSGSRWFKGGSVTWVKSSSPLSLYFLR